MEKCYHPLLKDLNLPPLPRQVSEQHMSRPVVPTEALTYYSRALLYHDHGQKDKAIEMYNQALIAFPKFTEAREGLRREVLKLWGPAIMPPQPIHATMVIERLSNPISGR